MFPFTKETCDPNERSCFQRMWILEWETFIRLIVSSKVMLISKCLKIGKKPSNG